MTKINGNGKAMPSRLLAIACAWIICLGSLRCSVSPPSQSVTVPDGHSDTPPSGSGKVIPLDTTTAYVTSTAALRSGTIPDSVFEMLELRKLHIQGGDCDYRRIDENGREIIDCWAISEIPSKIQNLQKLEFLGLNVNVLSALPAEIADLHSLKTLYLDDNTTLSQIDPVVGLDSLEELFLNGCYIKHMPQEIGQLKRLRSLSLIGNPIDASEQARIKAALPLCEIHF